VIVLLVILAATVGLAVAVWQEPGEPMSGGIVVSMVLGVVFSLAVGVNLLALIFYSSMTARRKS
jgi:hypothetical protein